MFQNAIENVFKTQLDKIGINNSYGIGDVQVFFENLDKEIEKTIGECSPLAPSLDLNQLDFDAMSRSESNRWTKLLGLHDQSIESHRRELIEKYRALISEGPRSIYVSLRNYFLRSILQDIREELGYGAIPPDARQTIKQRLDQIAANLKKCVVSFKDDYVEAVELRRAECVMIVTNNDDNKIDTDAENLSHLIVTADGMTPLLNNETMAQFLEKDQDDIVNRMTEHFRRLALRQIQSHDVVKEVQKHLAAGSPEIPNLSKRSNPYQTFQTTYQPLLPKPPTIIFGHDPIGNVLPNLTGTLQFTHHGNSSVDHLLFFYQEDFGFAMDDLDVFQTLKGHYGKIPPPGAYGHLTHQNPDFYNLELGNKTNRLTRWCKVLGRLVPEIRNRLNDKAFAGVFRLDYGRYVFEYHIDGLPRTLGLNNDADGIKLLSQMEHSPSYDKFIRDVQAEFAVFGRDKIATEIIKPLLHEVENLTTRNQLSQYYDSFLNEVYWDNDFTDKPDPDTELDEHFFQTQSPSNTSTPQQENIVTPSTQGTGNENVGPQSVDTDDYDVAVPEETELKTGTFNQTDMEHNEETPQDAADAEDDEYVWADAEPEMEHRTAEDTTGVEPSAEQQPQPEISEQKKQTSTGFSVKDVNVKQALQRKGTRKKE